MLADETLQRRLRALFVEELQDGLEVLTSGLLALEKARGAPARDQVQELFRAAHSLKGAAHAASVPDAVAICDRMESTFAAIRDGERFPDADVVTALLAETDRLTELAAGLREQQAGASPAPPPPAAAAAPAGRPPPSAAPSQPPPARPQRAEQPARPAPEIASATLRVAAERVDEVLRQAGEGLSAVRRLQRVADDAARAATQVEVVRARARAAHGDLAEDLADALDEAARAVGALARSVEVVDRALRHTSTGVVDAAQRLRTQPFAEACDGLDRVVRDVATEGGKSAQFELTGGDVDVDRLVVAALRDPLLHVVRNAVDHGIEPPAARTAGGKPATGTVGVAAALDGSQLTVTVRDDGAGFDLDRLRAAAARQGLADVEDPTELAFRPGLSTRDEVTAVSGRGVGLDAARARLEQLGGSISVSSRPGEGTAVTLTAPVTLAVLRVLLVRTGGQLVCLPTASVQHVGCADRQALRQVEGVALLELDGRATRAVSLLGALGLGADSPGEPGESLSVVVPRAGDNVLVADELIDELEVAVQPVPARLAGVPAVLGVAVLDGELPAIVVNPVAAARADAGVGLAAATEPAGAPARILLAEDTVTTRALERSILEAAGYSVAVAVDGADAWEQLQADGADLVVSDVDMPRMSGIELCRMIRSSSRFRELPVVLVTSLDTEADRQRGLEAGADAYVVKGEFQQGTLLDTIGRLL